jgi:hypothetical protein
LSGYVLLTMKCLWCVCSSAVGQTACNNSVYLFSGLLCRNQENLHILLRTNLAARITSTL